MPANALLVTRCDKLLQPGEGEGESTMKNRIVIDPEICHGKPVIKGTRVLVSNILGALAGGDTIEQIFEDYPNITRDDVHAALQFGSDLANFETIPYDAVMV